MMVVGLVVGELLELLEEAALLRGELSRHGDVDQYPVVASSETLQDGHPLAPQHPDLARLGAGVELELLRAVEGLHLDPDAERRLDDGEIDLGEDVVPLTHETVVVADAHLDVGVARPRAEPARVALAGEPDALAVMNPLGDLDFERPLLDRAAGTLARLAVLLDAPPRAVAVRTGRLADELAEDAARDVADDAGATAADASDRRGAGRCAVAVAGAAGDGGADQVKMFRSLSKKP